MLVPLRGWGFKSPFGHVLLLLTTKTKGVFITKSRKISYVDTGGKLLLPRKIELNKEAIPTTLQKTNEVFEKLSDVAPYVYELLGMRNLSAFVGAVFAKELQEASQGIFLLNPHQDGYPDLLLMDETGLKQIKSTGFHNRSKDPFSPFPTGGVEIKATCGDVPSAKELVKKGSNKPLIGDERISIVKSFNWKSHHRETNFLMGLLWDFIEGKPAITAVTFSSELEEKDWGRIVQPKEGGGRTTSVSIIAKSGIQKMLKNTLYVIDDERYIQKIKHLSGN